MAVGLLVILVLEGVRVSIRKYHKKQAKKYQYDGEFGKDYLGRPIDRRTGKRLTRNEARAKAAHKRESIKEREALQDWTSRGNQLPEYNTLTSKAAKDSETTISPPAKDDQGQEWQDWVVAGAPCYEETDPQQSSSSVVRS